MLMLLIDFFFFKQKTAYEMRISDWSSDVCSSDLCSILASATEALNPKPDNLYGRNHHDTRNVRDDTGHATFIPAHQAASHSQNQIGRASCRASVCQYV